MSDFDYKEGQFSLFQNDKKGNEKAPDMKGKGMINGKIVELSAWTKVSNGGKKFLSGQMKNKQDRPADHAPVEQNGSRDDLPF